MFFVDCSKCQKSCPAYSPSHAREIGWFIGKGSNFTCYCPGCKATEDVDSVISFQAARGAYHKREADKAAEVVGFNRPEDGSQERFEADRQVRPWASHMVWWFVHNAVAHLLIAVLPIKPFFTFHDWTSRKMHGV